MKVLMLLENSSYPEDGRVRHEARALVDAGHEVTVVCPRRREQPIRELLDGVHVWRFPGWPGASSAAGYLFEYGYSMTAAFLVSLAVLAARGFDVVHAHNPPDTFVLIGVIYKRLGKRFIFDHHDLSPELFAARFRREPPRLAGCGDPGWSVMRRRRQRNRRRP